MAMFYPSSSLHFFAAPRRSLGEGWSISPLLSHRTIHTLRSLLELSLNFPQICKSSERMAGFITNFCFKNVWLFKKEEYNIVNSSLARSR
jgi:hypothetical protein